MRSGFSSVLAGHRPTGVTPWPGPGQRSLLRRCRTPRPRAAGPGSRAELDLRFLVAGPGFEPGKTVVGDFTGLRRKHCDLHGRRNRSPFWHVLGTTPANVYRIPPSRSTGSRGHAWPVERGLLLLHCSGMCSQGDRNEHALQALIAAYLAGTTGAFRFPPLTRRLTFHHPDRHLAAANTGEGGRG